MFPLPLTSAERREFQTALSSGHAMRTRVSLLDRDEVRIASWSDPGVVTGGEVQVDATELVTRSLTLTLADPDRRLRFEPDSANDAAIWAANLVSVTRGIYVPALSEWVDVPVFTGPVVSFDRMPPEVTLQALGKEALALEPNVVWRSLTIRRGTKTTTAIRRILSAVGERKFSLPNLEARLKKDVSVARGQQAWLVCRRLARSIGDGRQLFYDGAGRVRLRRFPDDPTFTFHDGDDGNVLTRPGVKYDLTGVRNVVEVTGGIPRGAKQRVRAVAMPQRNHPLSPWSLARNGEPRFMVYRETNDNIRRKVGAESRANKILRDRLRAAVEVDFEALVAPHLEERDIAKLTTEDHSVEFVLRRFAIPLTADRPMPVGVNRRVSYGRVVRR